MTDKTRDKGRTANRLAPNGLPIAEETEGKLTNAQYEKLGKALETYFGQYVCEVCGYDNWALNSRLLTGLFLHTNSTGVTAPDFGTIHPLSQISCSRCGNTKFISLSAANINLFGGEDE